MKQLITDRLSQYTDLDHEQIEEITRQVFIALDLDQMHEPMTIDRMDYDRQLAEEHDHAFRLGEQNGAEVIVTKLCGDGIIANINEEVAYQTVKDLFEE